MINEIFENEVDDKDLKDRKYISLVRREAGYNAYNMKGEAKDISVAALTNMCNMDCSMEFHLIKADEYKDFLDDYSDKLRGEL